MNYWQQIPKKVRELDRLSQEFLSPAMVKEVFGISLGKAAILLEIGARYGIFQRQYIVRCKDCGVILEWFDYKDQIQPPIPCHADDYHNGFHGETYLVEKVYVRGTDE